MGISGKIEGIYSQRRLMEKRSKSDKCKGSSRRVQKGIQKKRKKNRRRMKRNARKIHGKITIWIEQ